MANNQGGLGIWAPPYNGKPLRSIPAFGNDPTFNHRENRIWVAVANSQPEITIDPPAPL
jgi:hypothetical protein